MNLRSLLSSERQNTRVGARFTSAETAESARDALRSGADLPESRVRIITPGDRQVDRKLEPESRGIAGTMVRAHVVMGSAGLALGVALAALLVVLDVQPFASSPLFSYLAIGLVATLLGLLLGGFIGFRPDHDPVIFAARKTSREGQWYLVVHLDDPDERDAVKSILDRFSDRQISTA